MSTLQRLSMRASLLMISAQMAVTKVLAADRGSFGGEIPAIPGTPAATSEGDIRNVILTAIIFVLNFLALIAVVFIIIAGIRLIVSQGEEEPKNKAKKTILYVIAGLLVVLFARVIVGFFTDTVPETFF